MVYLQAFRKYFRQAKNLIFLRNAGWHKSMANGDIEKKLLLPDIWDQRSSEIHF